MFDCHNNLFEEVAKFRAARRLWAKIMRERFGAKNPTSWMMRAIAATSGDALTAQQPQNNIVRGTIHALAGVLGGCQGMTMRQWDEALALPSDESAQFSVRTQQIIAYESGVADTVDPLGGSYLVESLTNSLEAEAAEYVERIDSLGGAIAAIEEGYIQRQIQDSSYRYQKDIESGKRVVVGVNKFVSPHPRTTGLLRIDPTHAKKQQQRLASLKRNRDNSRVVTTLKELESVARSTEDMMPAFLNCVEAYATVGEICDVLRGVFGEHKEFVVF